MGINEVFPFFNRGDPRLSSASLMGALLGVGRAAAPHSPQQRARVRNHTPAHPNKRAARKRKQKSRRANR